MLLAGHLALASAQTLEDLTKIHATDKRVRTLRHLLHVTMCTTILCRSRQSTHTAERVCYDLPMQSTRRAQVHRPVRDAILRQTNDSAQPVRQRNGFVIR